MEEDRTQQTRCLRCGTCCRSGSPTLQKEDAQKVLDGVLTPKHLYTLRAGEVVRDNVSGGLSVLGEERVKVRERQRPPYLTACCLYDISDKACTIYRGRPAQCAALECWDTSLFMDVYEGPKLIRKNIIHDSRVLGLMEEHDQRCAYVEMERVIKKIGSRGKGAIEELISLIQYDHRIRQIAIHELDVPPESTDLYFGRALPHTLGMFGIKAETQPDGSLILKKL